MGNAELFADISVGAVDDVCAGAVIPVTAFTYAVPLRFCAGEVDVGKHAAAVERIIAYARNAVGDSYTCKAAAAFERIPAYARDAVGDSYTCKTAAVLQV